MRQREREREREKTEEELWDTKENKLKKLNKYEKRGKEIESKKKKIRGRCIHTI